MKENLKLGVSHLDKTFFISEVSQECFDNSMEIERAGFFDVFKIKSQEDLNFRLNELKKLGYVNDE